LPLFCSLRRRWQPTSPPPRRTGGNVRTADHFASYLYSGRPDLVSEEPDERSGVARFVAASVLSLVPDTSLMYFSVQVMCWRYLASLILATAVVPPTNFVINYLWCFQAA
jgi:hypothetical protein